LSLSRDIEEKSEIFFEKCPFISFLRIFSDNPFYFQGTDYLIFVLFYSIKDDIVCDRQVAIVRKRNKRQGEKDNVKYDRKIKSIK